MIRAGGWRGVFLIVEGSDDERFWRPRVRVEPEAIVIAEGVRNLQDCTRSMPATLAGAVCAVADSDFRSFTPIDPFAGCADVYYYDEGFLETFILNTVALRKVLAVHADAARLTAFRQANRPHTVHSQLRLMASVFGRLRVLNEINAWGVCFERAFTPYRYVDEATWRLDEPRLFADYAAATGSSVAAVQAACAGIGRLGQIKLVHGHDSLKILAIGLRRVLGSSNAGPKALFADLCLAFETESFRHKKLISDLKTWAGARALI